jgi:hypothetical protein
VLGEGGLPLRFDVADARDGHTYEVHGAHPDAPAAGSARVSEIEVHLEPGNWEELSVSCGFDGEPSPEDAEELADVLRGFAIIGWYGAFTGPGGSDQARWSGKVHSMRMHLAPGELRAVYDMGSCPPGAVEMLCGALAGYSRERVPLAWVRIGGRAA